MKSQHVFKNPALASLAALARSLDARMEAAVDDKPKPELLESEKFSADLRASLYEVGNALREMREKPKDQQSDNWAKELRDTAHLVYGMDAELRIAEMRAADERAEKIAAERRGAGPKSTGANLNGSKAEHRSLGQQVIENEEYMTWAKRSKGSGTSPDIEVRAPSVIAGDPFLIGEGTYLDPNASAGLWVPRGTPYLPQSAIDQRRLFIRDLLAGGTTELQAIPYIRELNPRIYEEGATSVAEGTAKPEVSIEFSQDLAPVRKLAAWVPVTTEILEDAPTLASYINARLSYMLKVREEEQLLNGSGNGADLRGITQTPNIQSTTGAMADVPALIGKMIGLVEAVDGDASGIAMNPLDYWTMITARHSTWLDAGLGVSADTGSGLPYGQAPQTVWGLPAVRSRSMAEGQLLVGAFRTAAQLFDRSAASIRVGDQHADYFTNNKVAILIEERLALAVYRPDWFVLATAS